MKSNLDRYRKDLDSLIAKGQQLTYSMQLECDADGFKAELKAAVALKAASVNVDDFIKKLPDFGTGYQSWYSETKALVKALLPDRLSDFVGHYEVARGRKGINPESYRIVDYLLGLSVTSTGGHHQQTSKSAAIPQFLQQLAIVRSVAARFESSLFEIRQLLQADMFDSEVGAAQELAKSGFGRAAGALAGVVLERHLSQICDGHSVNVAKKNPTISVLNDALKQASVIDVPQWRFIQHLGDIRNLCDHSSNSEPTVDQVNDLMLGVSKVTKTVF